MRPQLILAVFCLIAMTALAGCSGSDSTSSNPPGDQNATVAISEFKFNPTTVNLHKGSTVTWTNSGAVGHTVTADGGAFDSGTVSAGTTYAHTFNDSGTFAYHCKIHPTMAATITVS